MSDNVGIMGYSSYVPFHRVRADTVVRTLFHDPEKAKRVAKIVRDEYLLRYLTVPNVDEDAATLAIEASENALRAARVRQEDIDAITAASENSAGITAAMTPHLHFRYDVSICDLGSSRNAALYGFDQLRRQIRARDVDCGLLVAADVPKADSPVFHDNFLGSASAAFVLGRTNLIASIEDVVTFLDSTSAYQGGAGNLAAPEVDERQLICVRESVARLLRKHSQIRLSDFQSIVFEQPYGSFPLQVSVRFKSDEVDVDLAERAKLTVDDIENKVKPWLRVLDTGDTCAASLPIALCDVLDHSQEGDDILVTSCDRGYSTSIWIKFLGDPDMKRKMTPTLEQYLTRRSKDMDKHGFLSRQQLGERLIGSFRDAARRAGAVDLSLCPKCKAVSFALANRCPVCGAELIARTFPSNSVLEEIGSRHLDLVEMFRNKISSITDCTRMDLVVGTNLERVIRRLPLGKDFVYVPVFRPTFRSALAIDYERFLRAMFRRLGFNIQELESSLVLDFVAEKADERMGVQYNAAQEISTATIAMMKEEGERLGVRRMIVVSHSETNDNIAGTAAKNSIDLMTVDDITELLKKQGVSDEDLENMSSGYTYFDGVKGKPVGSIFLAHSHSDERFVSRIGRDLRNHNIYVWDDDAEINVGDSLIEKISEGIDRMRYLGVVLSRSSVQSEWVKKEVAIAMTQEIRGRKLKVLPILIDENLPPGEIPIFLLDKLYADFTEQSLYQRSLNKLLKRLGSL